MGKRKKYTPQEITECPKCASTDFARFLYGLYEIDEKLKQQITDRKVILGGCELSFDNPIFHCNSCNYEF